ncbi:PREDICTED: lisH domain-containing protein C1711.05 isoform X2 [Prunus mume]|uniref:LisH domain-containing protein C1711.05 isoform X2 n=1 Tax=Prunus mume TaxID=102107 RepID=A0ABM0NF49_PRUMU|nr:PREDICTED: lisH domain-containing protein C1711.05 isoform X2 [Prunus mume]
MPKSLTSTQDTINPTLLAFRPRQVQLANLENMKHSKPNISSDSTQTLSPGQKGPLLHAVARFLESNGFSKTLKKFRSEAQIEKSGLKESSLDLEEMYCKLMCHNGVTNVNSQKKKDVKEPEKLLEETEKNCMEKKKKKSKVASDSLASDSETEKKPKDKKKKKNKSSSDSVDANGIGKSTADEIPVDEKSVKPNNGKKKKKDGLVSESLDGEDVKVLGIGDTNGTSSTKDNLKISDVDATGKDSKRSKKRKRLESEGNDSQPADNREDEESKRRKVESLKASKGSEQPANSDASLGKAENAGKDSRGESGQVGPDVFQKASVTQLDGQANGNLEKSAEKSSIKKSVKNQRDGSDEPTAFKAFQRVKAEEVEFVDEKLRDNSYWAKDGAEIGYGAKAQEVLGQVRGRDFRHEKTKKKRGSYRGGQIDQQSHSVKFNYGDED